MRLFYALEIGDAQRDIAACCQDRLSAAYGSARLRRTAASDLHVTLLFLGEQPVDSLPEFIAAGMEIAGQFEGFSLTLTDIGAFPDLSAPRVLWLGVREDEEHTASKLSQAIRTALPQPTSDVMPFKPHVTLARLKSPVPAAMAALACESLAGGISVQPNLDRVLDVKRFVLMETLPVGTHTNPGESRYNIVHSFLLQKPRAIPIPAVNP